jgi:hypothetical protein
MIEARDAAMKAMPLLRPGQVESRQEKDDHGMRIAALMNPDI